jgi:tetrahydromethanopterin S-methyltransferase subunit F
VLALATAGAAVDAAGGSVADIADTNQLFGIDMTVVKGLSGRRCPTS